MIHRWLNLNSKGSNRGVAKDADIKLEGKIGDRFKGKIAVVSPRG